MKLEAMGQYIPLPGACLKLTSVAIRTYIRDPIATKI